MNKKIAILTDSINQENTGVGIYTLNLLNILTNRFKDNRYYSLDYLKKELNKVDYIIVNNPFYFMKNYSWHNYVSFKISGSPLDYIFNVSGTPHLFPYKQKEILFVHDISWHLFNNYHKSGRSLYFKFLFKNSLNNCFRVVAASENTKTDLVKYFNIEEEKINVIYPFLPLIPTKEVKPDFIDANPYILYVGTIEPRKNIDAIIYAYSEIKKRKKIPHKLIIAGKKGWKYSNTINLVSKLGMKEHIVFSGYITDKQKKYLYKHADFFVYPSFYEGFGIPVVEAMLYGCPVITSNISSLPEVCGDSALQINPFNSKELIDSMEKMLFNNNLKQKLIQKGKHQASKFSNTKQIEHFINCLQ